MEAKKPDNEDEEDNDNEDDIKKKKQKKKFKAPTLDEIQKYVSEKKLNVNAKNFYDYFTEGNWIDSNGNKVKSWKQKILTWNGYTKVPDKKVSNTNNHEQRQYTDEQFESLYAN